MENTSFSGKPKQYQLFPGSIEEVLLNYISALINYSQTSVKKPFKPDDLLLRIKVNKTKERESL